MQRLPFLVLGLLLCGNAAALADTVLVLPFFNESASQNIDWIGEGIAETIRESLASQGVLVLSREDRLEAYRRLSIRPNAVLTHASIIKLGEALDASQVIYGHYEIAAPQPRDGASSVLPPAGAGAPQPAVSVRDSLHMGARILDLKRTRQSPEFEEIGALEDLASLETHLAWRCLNSLSPKTPPSKQDFRRDRPPVRLTAMATSTPALLPLSPTP